MTDCPLSPKQIIAASQIAIGKSNKIAAKQAGVTPQTISEWMKNPNFVAAINQTKQLMLFEAQDKLRGLVFSAIGNLAKILRDSDNEKLKLDAAKYILDTIQIAPMEGLGLWYTDPITADGVQRDQLKKSIAS